MRTLLFVLLLCVSIQASCQTFIAEVEVPRVEADGFYRILIPPALSPYLNFDFTNARIYDQNSKEVPYLFQKETTVQYTENFKEYEIVEKRLKKNCCTNITLKNPDNKAINNINLFIKNAEVTKHATLLGSDDQKNWFALKHHFILSNLNSYDKTSEIKIIDFPLSNYTYYLLQIEDSTTAPINILKAGYYEINSEEGKYGEIKSFKVVKSDSARQKKSFIEINFDAPQVIDKVNVSLTGVPYFLRKASLQIKKQRKDKKGKAINFYETVSEFELSSKQESILEFPGLKATKLLLTIENEDNPNLEIATLKMYQLNRYFVVWLTKENHYKLKLGNSDMQAPSYDLGFFKNSIPNEPAALLIGSITLVQKQKHQTGTTIFTSKSIIWVAIVLVIAVLGFMSAKLIRETSTKEE